MKPVLHLILSFEGSSYENYNSYHLFYFLFCISRYHFLQIFRTSFNLPENIF